jgi:hypothetical protein
VFLYNSNTYCYNSANDVSVSSFLSLTLRTALAYLEVIPGPGLPSLAELGLTSKMLYAIKPNLSNKEPSANLKRQVGYPWCNPIWSAKADGADITACYNYLNNLGQTPCVASDAVSYVVMCTAGSGNIVGESRNGVVSNNW